MEHIMLWPKIRNCICTGFTWQEQEQPRTGDRVSEQLAVTGSASPFCDHLLYIVVFPISKNSQSVLSHVCWTAQNCSCRLDICGGTTAK